MDLLVVRHAIAAEGDDDDLRPLTDEGRRRFARVARHLGEVGPRIDVVLHSPKVRAVQTAEMLGPLAATCEELAALAEPPTFELLRRLDREERAAVVGHSPWLEALLGWLLFGDPALGAPLDLRKGGWAWLIGEPRPGGMRLRALVPPRISRR